MPTIVIEISLKADLECSKLNVACWSLYLVSSLIGKIRLLLLAWPCTISSCETKLPDEEFDKYDENEKIIIACMALHNFIRETKLPDEEFDKYDKNENYMTGGEEPFERDDVLRRRVDMNSVRDTNSLWSSMEE
jgi:hypothetical protein